MGWKKDNFLIQNPHDIQYFYGNTWNFMRIYGNGIIYEFRKFPLYFFTSFLLVVEWIDYSDKKKKKDA